MPDAELLFSYRAKQGALTVEMLIWRLPGPDADRPHGLHFRLYLGRAGRRLVLYDTHTGKAAHRHAGGREEPYPFSTVDRLFEDFRESCARHGWQWDDE